MLSWWERTALLDYDVIVVGGGIVGLSTACSLLERRTELRVLVVERGVLPAGASTRNAGFACYGSASEVADYVNAMTPDGAIALVKERWLGIARLRERLGDDALHYEAHGSHELLSANQLGVLDRLPELNALLRPVFGSEPYRVAPRAREHFGFSASHVAAVIENPLEGQLHPGHMMRALLHRAQSLGAVVLHGAEVTSITDAGEAALVTVRDPVLGGPIEYRGRQAAVCVDAFARRLLPHLDVVPGRGQVLVTEPIPGHRLRGTFHRDSGDIYFRALGDRVLLGGGRHTDVAGETTDSLATTSAIQAYLERFLGEVVLPGRAPRIEHRWAGIMAFGRERLPILERVSPHLAVGVRTSGMGIAIGSRIGDRLADLLLAAF